MTKFPITPTVTKAKRISRIRSLAENISVQVKSDGDILDMMDRWDSIVMDSARNHSWDGTEDNFESAISASNYFIASEILDDVNGMETKAAAHMDKAKFILRTLNKKDTENQSRTSIDPISVGINITNELDPAVYTPDQDVFGN